jgi:hypothetical protein
VHVTEPDFTIEVFELSVDPHDRERFRRRMRAELHGHPAFLPSPEDVVVTKLRWARRARRTKDMEDLKNVVGVQRGFLDLTYIRTWCDQHGTRELFEQILESLPHVE